MIGALLLAPDLDVPERPASCSALIPTPATFEHFGELLSDVGAGHARVRRAGARQRRRCCSSPCSASARWRSWSTCVAVGPAPAGAGRPADARDLLGAGRGLRRTASRCSRSWSAPSASCGCWSPTTSTGYAGSAAGSPATAATSTCGSRPRWPPPAAGWPWSAWSLAVLLPLAVPGMTAACSTSFGTAATARAPGRRRRRRPAGQPVRRAQRPAATRPRRPTWSRSPPTTRTRSTCASASPTSSAATASAAGRRSGQSVSREPARPAGRPAPASTHAGSYRATVEITDELRRCRCCRSTRRRSTIDGLDGDWLVRPEHAGRLLQPARPPGARTTRSTTSASTYTPEALRTAPPLPADDPIRRQLHPACRRYAEVDELVDRADRGQDDRVRQGPGDLRLLLAGERLHLHPADQGGHQRRATSSTSSTSKQGFCEQYAAAMAWMVRAAGIPARVAFGFTSGSNRDGNTYTLTNLNLHAWTEVYFRLRLGAVRRDPGGERRRLDPLGVGARHRRAAGAPRRRPAARPAPGERPASAGPRPAGPGPTGHRRGPRRGAATLGAERARPGRGGLLGGAGRCCSRCSPCRRCAGCCCAAGGTAGARPRPTALAAPGRRDRARTRDGGGHRRTPTRARADAHAAWDELLDTMVDFRVPVDPTETPRATAERLVRGHACRRRRPPRRRGCSAGPRSGPGTPASRSPASGSDRGAARGAQGARRAGATGAPGCWRVAAAAVGAAALAAAVVDASTAAGRRGRPVRDRLLRWSPRRLLADRAR